ncbi:Ras GTPase [Acrasis kona]|uniref:Ras GTPase n=1 Tax=Acrasis kona TaxID=1008807 RepID=A0AAW2ZG16_9EUKA
MLKFDYLIGVVGPRQCGKTSIIKQFISKTFSEVHDETIEEIYTTKIHVDITEATGYVGEKDNISCSVDILDTGGSMESSVSENHLKKCDGYLVVCSCEDKSSFSECLKYIDYLKRLKEGPIAAVIVQNKCDTEEQIRPTLNFGIAYPLLKTSARTNNGIEEVFRKVICEIVYVEFTSGVLTEGRMREMDRRCLHLKTTRRGSPSKTPSPSSLTVPKFSPLKRLISLDTFTKIK